MYAMLAGYGTACRILKHIIIVVVGDTDFAWNFIALAD
jgi:hypothetical protein